MNKFMRSLSDRTDSVPIVTKSGHCKIVLVRYICSALMTVCRGAAQRECCICIPIAPHRSYGRHLAVSQ